MAQQPGNIKITGTIDNLTFYKMDGIYYVRKKSSLSRKKVLTSPNFERTRMHAAQFKQATKIASRLYRPLKKEEKSIKLFRKMVGRAKTLLHKGKEVDQIIIIITEEMLTPISITKPKIQPIIPKPEKSYTEINQQHSELNTETLNSPPKPELSDIYVDNNGNLVGKTLHF